jgi:hypothetical protein
MIILSSFLDEIRLLLSDMLCHLRHSVLGCGSAVVNSYPKLLSIFEVSHFPKE